MCIRDRVSRGENYENIIKNSGDKILEEVECNNGMLVCVDESERKWRESIDCLLYTSLLFFKCP